MPDKSARHGYVFGVIIDAFVNPYQRNITEALISAAEDFNAELCFFLGGRINSGQKNEDRMKYIYQLVSRENIDGVILVSNCLMIDGSAKSAFARRFQPFPFINIGGEIPGR